jgi:uncharacterized hydantoinase/oxoprolinase family protein
MCPVAAEVFATTADAYILLGDIAEQPDAVWTADGRPLTREFARERLARMICADRTQFDSDDAWQASAFIRDAQLAKLAEALGRVIARSSHQPACSVTSGSGEFLARRLVQTNLRGAETVSLADRLGATASSCAPAHALAVLAQEANQ